MSDLKKPVDWLRPGEVICVSEPEFIGRFPVKQETITIPADPSPKREIGFVVRTYSGGEVYLLGRDGKVDETPLTSRSDLKPGMEIAVPTLLGYTLAVVRDMTTWESQGCIGNLEFDIDDRHCWTSSDTINKKCLTKLSKLTMSSSEDE